MKLLKLLIWTTTSALGLGIILLLLTNFFANSNFSGPGWSLQGNGALIVPVGVGPAVLSSGWVALMLLSRGSPTWLKTVVSLGLIGLVPAILSLAVLTVAGDAAGGLYAILIVAPWLGALVSPIMAHFMVKEVKVSLSGWWYFLAGVLYPIGLVIGYFLTSRVIPT